MSEASTGSRNGVDQTLTRLFEPADRARGWLLKGIGARVGWALSSRERRVTVLGSLTVLAAFVFAHAAVVPALFVGPLLLGVPHLVADLRHLVVQPGQLERKRDLLWVFLPLVAGTVTAKLWVGCWSLVAVAAIARCSWRARAVAVLGSLAIVVAAARLSGHAEPLFAHAHNFIAVALWWRCRRSRPLHQRLVPLLFFLGVGVSLTAGDSLVLRFSHLDTFGPAADVDELARTVAPGFGPVWTLRALALFAFAQAVHYGVWVRLIPEETRAGAGMRSFSGSYRALARDCGTPFAVGALALTALFLTWGGFDAAGARTAYLRLAMFHGPLELALALLAALERRPLLVGSR